jgi:integrase/recombinase XerD
MTAAQLAAVSFLARYAGHTHDLYAYQLRRWFELCEANGLDPLVGIQRAHVELYIRGLGSAGLMASSTNTMMHGVRGFFRFAHIDGLIPADPAVYARLPKVHADESRTQGLDRLELIRFLQFAQTITVHHAAITNALDAGVPLRDAQILARHAEPRTTEHYDRARGNLDRHGVHFLTAYVAGV